MIHEYRQEHSKTINQSSGESQIRCSGEANNPSPEAFPFVRWVTITKYFTDSTGKHNKDLQSTVKHGIQTRSLNE